MSNVLICYYSAWGHVARMAEAVADGVGEVAGAEAIIKRVPELGAEPTAQQAGAKREQPAPIAEPEELADYDAVIFWYAHPVREHGRAAAPLPRSNG